ncbi:MAG: histidine phosphatase family protein [Solobacterium sp.]|jgi:broad specificity phosphatase PhoE|nr:histidine phosphatase family protein [Solobacterium sp.]MCH4222514.1 histidine phosphatase family protein [Solobacterium sp.]MCH4265469.1 histidine phosphatase family protein [Solobacterium sp.]
MKKLTFYMVRHGETMFNVMGRIQGSCDSPLTEKGIKDGEAASLALKDVPFTRAYSSTSERAMDTAKLILKAHDIPLHEIKGLKEFDFGKLDGERSADIIDEIRQRKQDDSFNEVGGENTPMINERIDATFNDIESECKDGDVILVVSHGLYILNVLQHLLNVDTEVYRSGFTSPKKFIVPNGGIMKFTWTDGVYQMISFPAEPSEFKDIAC